MHTNTATVIGFKATSARTRLLSAAAGGLCSVGLLFAVVGGLLGQSAGLPLGDFVTPQQWADEHGAVFVAAASATHNAA